MISLEPVSEDSILIRFRVDTQETVSATLTQKILRYRTAIENALASAITDLVPGYTTLLCVYDPTRIDFRRACATIRSLSSSVEKPAAKDLDALTTAAITIPVYYDPEAGSDLVAVAEHCGLTIDEVINKHADPVYHVFAMGFCPGFAFLGSVDPAISVPRHKAPRQKVPAGSVAIANQQTAVYPIDSPGGWHLIGRSPTRFFNKQRLSLLQPGNRVQFQRISRQAYLDQGGLL